MGVVVKMDMPKSCGMCECSGTSVCREWMKVDRRDMGSKRADSCPILCELPEKHGRLIDLDEFLKQIGLEDSEENREDNVGEIVTLEDFDNTPAIIEAEGEE